MKKLIIAIKDTKSGFKNTNTVENEDIAKRHYKMLLSDKDSEIGQFPSDFELWMLGYYNTITGEIEPSLELIATAATINKKGVE